MRGLNFEAVSRAVPIHVVCASEADEFVESLTPRAQAWLATLSFSGKKGQLAMVPDQLGALEFCILGLGEEEDAWSFGALPAKLPAGDYCFATTVDPSLYYQRALAWALGCYCFDAYKASPPIEANLFVPAEVDHQSLESLVSSVYLVRDLVNTPTEDLGPEQLSQVVSEVAKELGAEYREIVGEDLIKENYPLVYHVGKGSVLKPRLAELCWGDPEAPLLALVGKGVCFDAGGLQIKTTHGMKDMKKDMGGAAHALALTRLIIQANLPVRLRLLVPCVENSVSGSAYRPGDILPSRQGSTVEITNTDAEGRLIMADALTSQVEKNPDLLIDFATLTGAGRIALGPDIPALMSNRHDMLLKVLDVSTKVDDPVWPLPLYKAYESFLDSDLADIANAASQPYGGAITAGLFLQHFVPNSVPWLHLDLMAANISSRPGRPLGGEAQGLQTMLAFCSAFFKVPVAS